MSNAVIDRNVSVSNRPGKGLSIALWVVQGLLALTFAAAASGKLLGQPEMVGLFDAIGVGQWFRYVTGVVELTGAALILVPKTRVIGAGLLAGTMLCAIALHLFVLQSAPTAPVVLLALASFVLWGRRAELAKLLGRS
jgi:putative oxidoreductase